MLVYDIKIFLRKIVRYKNTFIINITGLSTGLACVLLITLWVADELSTDKFHENDSHLYQVVEYSETDGTIITNPRTAGLVADNLIREFPEIEYCTSVRETNELNISFENTFLKATGLYAGEEFFEVFSFPLLEGDKSTILRIKNSIVLSETLAVKLFGSINAAVGKTILLGKNKPFVVSGVSDRVPSNSSIQFDFVISFEFFKDINPNTLNWSYNTTNAYLVLKNGVDPEKFNAKIKDFIRSKSSDKYRTLSTRLFSDSYLYSNYENGVQKGGRIEYVKLIALIAFLILLIACINFMNLSTANASRRLKEIGIKKALGSRRKALIFQFLGESIYITFISLLFALFIADFLIPQFNEVTGKHLTLTFSIHYFTIISSILFITGIIAGSYPAFYLSGLNTITTLKAKLNISIGEIFARRGLVIFQFVLSVILIVFVLVIYMQIEFVQNKNLGYNKENIIYFDLEENIQPNIDPFLSALQQVDGIEKASSIGTNIVGGNNTFNSLDWPGKNSDEKVVFQMRAVNYGMIELFDIAILKGRTFSKDFGAEDSKIIFNQAAINVMGLNDPIGKEISIQGTKFEIIGVTEDFHFASLYQEIKPLFFVLQPSWTNIVMAKITKGKEQLALNNLKDFYQQYNPGKQLDYKFLDDTYKSQYIAEQRVSIMARYFAGLAILISCMGLLGLSTFNAERRRKEISIRKIFGQKASQIAIMLSSEFTKLVLVSIIIALPFAYLVTDSWLSSFAYKVSLQMWYYLVAGIVALLIAILTVGSQAIHYANKNPVDALRYE
jgi:putative ABC transport system permease protein